MLNTTIDEAVEILKKGGTIIYPSDTVWALGCDATNKIAINKIFKIKKRDRRLPLICLMNSIEMLERYVYVGNREKKFLKSIHKTPMLSLILVMLFLLGFRVTANPPPQ